MPDDSKAKSLAWVGLGCGSIGGWVDGWVDGSVGGWVESTSETTI